MDWKNSLNRLQFDNDIFAYDQIYPEAAVEG